MRKIGKGYQKKRIESIVSPRSVHCDDLRVCTYAEGIKYDKL